MKTLIPILFLIASLSCFSQDKLRVRYQTQFLVLTNQMDNNEQPISRWMASGSQYELNVAGNLSSFRSVSDRTNFPNAEPGRNMHVTSLPAARFINYTNTASKRLYTPVPSITEKTLMVDDSIAVYKWTFTELTDTICGFACRMAVATSNAGYIYAWYAYEFPHSFGPFSYTGLPGTVLAVEFSDKAVRYIAVDVNEEAAAVEIPDAAHISAESYAVLSKEKRKYRAGLFGKRVDPQEVPRLDGSTIPDVPTGQYFNTVNQSDPFLPIKPYYVRP